MLQRLLAVVPLVATTVFAAPVPEPPEIDLYSLPVPRLPRDVPDSASNPVPEPTEVDLYSLPVLRIPRDVSDLESNPIRPLLAKESARQHLRPRNEEALVEANPAFVAASPAEVAPVADAGVPAVHVPAVEAPAVDVSAPVEEVPVADIPTTDHVVEYDAADESVIENPPPVENIGSRANGYRNILYYTSWSIYGANYQPQQLPVNRVSHLLYAFAQIASDGTVKPGDSYADVEKRYASDSWSEPGTNAYGVVKQLYLHKKRNRKLKTLLSIGGWTYQGQFPPATATAATRKRFAATAVQLMADWGMDGIDIDWEYPKNVQEANNYVLLLKEVRAALDNLSSANSLNYRFIITIASPAGPQYNTMKLGAMNPYVDAWHLMSYDYAGSWDSTTGHASNIFLSKTNPTCTKFSTDAAINAYIRAGVPASKITMGIPLYGRSFRGTAGLGKPYSGVGGGAEPGVYPFKDLPKPGLRPLVDRTIGATYTYDASAKELVTYDGVASAVIKADYIKRRGLGGAFFWEAKGDKAGALSLVKVAGDRLGSIEGSTNNLRYQTSQYANIRKGMA